MARPTPPAIAGTPDFGKNVIILDSKETPAVLNQKISTVIAISIVQTQDGSEFAHDRYAIFFKPGIYNLTVDVGYYMTVHGLGDDPDKVTINGQIRSPGSSNPATIDLALNNFWRGVENLAISPPFNSIEGLKINTWAVSQATFMRRVHLVGNAELWLWARPNPQVDPGYASGGFIADSSFDGAVNSASQQQFITRNSLLNG